MIDDELIAKMEDAHYHGGMRAALAVARREVLREASVAVRAIADGPCSEPCEHLSCSVQLLALKAIETLASQSPPAATETCDGSGLVVSRYTTPQPVFDACPGCPACRRATP